MNAAGQAPDTIADPSLVGIERKISGDGAAAYLSRVDDDDVDWQQLLARLSQGDPEAVSLAARLRPVADAGRAEALDMAAARGLVAAPLAVLGLVGAGATVDTLCTSPFIEPAPDVARRYNMAALAALDGVPASRRPQPTFDQCRRALTRVAALLPR